MKPHCFSLLLTALGALILPSSLPAEPSFFFRDGDRVMILGDSITEQRQYSTLVESFVLSRFPDWKITCRNTGWGGDTMGLRIRDGLEKGFARDLAPLNPTAVTITFGMNDARSGDATYDAYLANARALTAKFAALGTRVAFITPSSEEHFQDGHPAGSPYNPMLLKYADGLTSVAQELNLPFVDQLSPMIAVIEAGRKSGVLPSKGGGVRLVPDGIHPNWAGHFVMAATILKGLHAPALVSAVEVDAATGKVRTENATVSDVKTGEVLSFTRRDQALPWPVPSEALLVAQIPGFTPFDDLSRYELKVTNLSASKYQVALDGVALGTYTKADLAAGINLSQPALSTLPVLDQLLQAIVAKNEIFYQLWRAVKVTPVPAWIPVAVVEQYRDEKVKELEAKLAEAEARIDIMRIPQAARWTLTPVLEN